MAMSMLRSKKSGNTCKESVGQRVERLLQWKPSFELKVRFPYFLTGYDKAGSPVWVCRWGSWDVRSLVEEGGELKDEFNEYIDQFLVNLTHSPRTKALPGKTDQNSWSMIVDLSNYNNSQIAHFRTLQTVLGIVKKAKVALKTERNVKKIRIVNSNNFFMTLWKMAAPILGEMINHFELYGTNSQKWQEVLLENIEKDQLPSFLGGTKNSESCRRSSITSH